MERRETLSLDTTYTVVSLFLLPHLRVGLQNRGASGNLRVRSPLSRDPQRFPWTLWPNGVRTGLAEGPDSSLFHSQVSFG